MSTRKQLVSVIIPCYNQGRFLGEAIESVLAQTHPHFEIIVVDDGSTDDTSEVAARYPHVRCIRQKNQGQATARNTGLGATSGSYLVFLDSDDRLLPHALEAGLQCLNAHPECAFVSGQCQLIASGGSPLSTKRQPFIEQDHYLALLTDNYIWMPAMAMHRRATFDSVGVFNTSLRVRGAEDYDLYLRITQSFPVCCHAEVVAEYRVHGSSTSSNPERMLKATLTVHRSQQDYVRGNKQYEEAYKTGVRSWQERYGEILADKVRTHVRQKRGEMRQALHGMGVLLRYYPRGLVTHARRKLSCVAFKAKESFRFSNGEKLNEDIVTADVKLN